MINTVSKKIKDEYEKRMFNSCTGGSPRFNNLEYLSHYNEKDTLKRIKITILTGAGVSASSGISTFRDMNGLWNKYNIEEVASSDAWVKNPQLVCDFYNERRKILLNAKPNFAHEYLKTISNTNHVTIITQNVDDLHERAGSQNILHLHGELLKVRCTGTNKVYDWNKPELNVGDLSPDGFQLRPHIVWFGENVLEIDKAIKSVKECDVLIIMGTSLQVYPANKLLDINNNIPIIIVNNNEKDMEEYKEAIKIIENCDDIQAFLAIDNCLTMIRE